MLVSGSGVAIYTESAPVLLKKPVSKKSISYHGKLVTTDLALEFAQPYQSSHQHINKIIILSDCEAAINMASNFQYPSMNLTDIICKIYKQIKDLNKKSINIEFLWTAGHASITGNELADKCAKEVAQEAINLRL